MFVDYITVMLVNMVAGLTLLGLYFLVGLTRPTQKHWAAAMAMVGLVALATGLHMTLTWPMPRLAKVNLQWANIAFGEMSVLFGVLFLGAALAVAKGWSLIGVGVYAFFAGAAAIVVGLRVAQLGLTQRPELSAAGFILGGLGGVLACPIVALRHKALRAIGAIVLFVAAAVWALVGYGSYWMHLQSFAELK